MKIDFIQIIDIIFKNKMNYKKLDNIDKENNFFIINRKFAVKYLKQAQFFNSKHIDKASAMDMWYLFFKNTKQIPYWYWNSKSNKKKEKTLISVPDKKILIEHFDLSTDDYNFLYKYYLDDLLFELKKIKRFEN